MSRPRIDMRKIREVLRLTFEEGLSRRQVSAASGVPSPLVKFLHSQRCHPEHPCGHQRMQVRRILALCPRKGQLQSVRSRRLPTAWCGGASMAYGVRWRLGYKNLTARNVGHRRSYTSMPG